MAYAPELHFESLETLAIPARCAVIAGLVEVFAAANQMWLADMAAQGIHVPGIYESGARFQIIDPLWRDIPELLKTGVGDCKDFTAWRLAEIRRARGEAVPIVRHRQLSQEEGGDLVYHVLLQDPKTGVTEDPSKFLGMGDDEWSPFYL